MTASSYRLWDADKNQNKKGWDFIPLGQLLEKKSELVEISPTETYKEVTVRLWGRGVTLRSEKAGSEITAKKRLRVHKGQFIFSRIDARNGAFGIIPNELDGAVVSNDFPVHNPKKDLLITSYLGWLSRMPAFVDACRAVSEGTTNRVRLKEEGFYRIEVPLPPLPEQRRIVAKIERLAGKIEEAIDLKQKINEAAPFLIRSIIGEIDKTLKNSCEMAPFEDFAEKKKGAMRSGPFGSALLHSEFVDVGIPAIGIQDVQENEFVLSNRWKVLPEKAKELERYKIQPRDILITVMGTLGRACAVPEKVPEMVSTKHVWTITLDLERVNEKWVSYWLNYSPYVREALLGVSSGTAIPGLNGKKIKSLPLPVISIEQQNRIVKYLDDLQSKIDALKSLQAKTAAELDALLPSILDKAFKGHL